MIPRDLQRRIAVRLDPVYVRGRLTPPYRPAQRYPELSPVSVGGAPNSTCTYDAMRDLLHLWHAGGLCPTKPDFSPLSGHVEPGMRVAIKPNFIFHTHRAAMRGCTAQSCPRHSEQDPEGKCALLAGSPGDDFHRLVE